MPDTATADAPGRVNLIGEHTDYHGGFVLPTVIPQRTRVVVRRRADRRVTAASVACGTRREQFMLGEERAGRGWLDYVQGVTATLVRHGIQHPGFDTLVESDIPIGAGVSSSAALEVSLLRALRLLFDLPFDDVALARLAQEVETHFVGAPVGIMDQMASSLGRENEALFLDTATLAIERIPLPASVQLVVIHSGITHAHAGGEYVTRRRESFEAAARLGVDRLRDLDTEALTRVAALPSPLDRRARHILTENERVLASVAALRVSDAQQLGALFTASHASMRDDYEISTADIDTLVAIANAHPAVFGARLTGGGFGGAIVALAKAGEAAAAARAIIRHYSQRTGHSALILLPSE